MTDPFNDFQFPHLANAIDPIVQPTPEQLVEALYSLGGASDAETVRTMDWVIRSAERGGKEHMAAVSGWVTSLPAPDQGVGRYDKVTGRPAWFDGNILIELRVRLGSREFVAREAVDVFLFETRFECDVSKFEVYLKHFIQLNFGRIACADDESYQYFRDRLWIVHPSDRHDLKRCLMSAAAGVWPTCESGLIMSRPASFSGSSRPMALCPCRCHRDDLASYPARQYAQMHHLPTFNEGQM